jgi:hypothetical protein
MSDWGLRGSRTVTSLPFWDFENWRRDFVWRSVHISVRGVVTLICTCVVFVSDTKDGVRGSLPCVLTGVLPGGRPIHIYLIAFFFRISRRTWSPVLDSPDKCNILDPHVLLHTIGSALQEITVAYVSSRCASYGRTLCGRYELWVK